MSHGAFQEYLQAELASRCEKNPRYSLRAFARSLGMSHATLSHLLRGTRKLSIQAQIRIGKALGLSERDLATLGGVDPGHQKVLGPRKRVTKITLENFAPASDWYFDAILELTRTKAFKPDPKWIASRLGITVSEVHFAVQALKKLGHLAVMPSGQWIDSSGDNTNISGFETSELSARKLQKQILAKAALAIDEVDGSRRNHTSLAVAIDPNDLPEVRERIREFRRELWAFLQRPGIQATEVYQLAVAFFPLSETYE